MREAASVGAMQDFVYGKPCCDASSGNKLDISGVEVAIDVREVSAQLGDDPTDDEQHPQPPYGTSRIAASTSSAGRAIVVRVLS